MQICYYSKVATKGKKAFDSLGQVVSLLFFQMKARQKGDSNKVYLIFPTLFLKIVN